MPQIVDWPSSKMRTNRTTIGGCCDMPSNRNCEGRYYSRRKVTPLEYRAPDRHCFVEAECTAAIEEEAEELLHDNHDGSVECVQIEMLVRRDKQWFRAHAVVPVNVYEEFGADDSCIDDDVIIKYLIISAEWSIDNALGI